jgi:hypothetical protein
MGALLLGALVVWGLGGATEMGHSAGENQDISVSEPYQYARAYSDSMGESHFADDEMTFELMDYAPDACCLGHSQTIPLMEGTRADSLAA